MMSRLSIVFLVAAAAACGSKDSSAPEGNAASAPGPAAEWWPGTAGEWAEIAGECSGDEGHESWCGVPAPTEIALLGAFIEERPALVLALARDPARRERLDELFAYLLTGDVERGAGRVGGIAVGVIAVTTSAMLEGWKQPTTDDLGAVLRALLLGARLSEERGGPGLDAIAAGIAGRLDIPPDAIAGDTPRAHVRDMLGRALAAAVQLEAERLRVDFANETCDRTKPGAADTLGCRHEAMSGRMMKMLTDLGRTP